MTPRDGPVGRRAWTAFASVAALAGPRSARALVSAPLRLASRRRAGYGRAMMRVGRHETPGLWKVPAEWNAVAPQVSVRRLGLRLELDLRDNLQRTVYYAGTYEPDVLAFLDRELAPGDVLADVGAHVGVHALSAARHDGVRVLAFEPATDSATKLRAAAARNGVRVEVVETALGAEPGEVELRADPDYAVADAGVRSQHGAGAVVARVPVTTFDAWASHAGLDRLDIVKIDVEGAEPLVLRGMVQSLRRLRPRAVVVEAKGRIMERAGVDDASLEAPLRDAGYAPAGDIDWANRLFRPAEVPPLPS